MVEEKQKPVDKMKIVIDTNIIFSALLHTESKIGDIIFNSQRHFDFYSCSYMLYEIQKHWLKLKNISKLSEKNLQVSYAQILSKLNFINEEIVPVSVWQNAERIASAIDIDDTDFIALAYFLNAGVWTGDKKLHAGLKKIKFRHIFNTQELWVLRLSNR